MRTVHKYEVRLSDRPTTVEMPRGATVVQVGEMNIDAVALWAIVDTEQPIISRCFLVTGTGRPVPRLIANYQRADDPPGVPGPQLQHVGTHQTRLGHVWHVWEQPPRTTLR